MPNESIYVGFVTAGEFGPLGKLYEYEGGQLIYDGHFHRGVPHGRGTMTSTDPPYLYEGFFYQGKRHGDGSLIFPDETVLSTQWKNDKPFGTAILSSKRNKKQKIIKCIEDECPGDDVLGLRWRATTFIALDGLYWGPGSGLGMNLSEWSYLADLGQGHWAEHVAHARDLHDDSALSEAETIAPPNEDDSKNSVRIFVHRAEGLITSKGPFTCQVKLRTDCTHTNIDCVPSTHRAMNLKVDCTNAPICSEGYYIGELLPQAKIWGDLVRETRSVGGSHPEWQETLELRRESPEEKLLMFTILSETGEVVGGCFSDLDDFQEVMQLTGRDTDGMKGYAGRLHVKILPPLSVHLSESDDLGPILTETIRAQTSTHTRNIVDHTNFHYIPVLQQQPTI